MEKLFHPSIHVVRSDANDREMLEISALFLHDLGWLTQQGNFDEAIERLRWWKENEPEAFLKALGNGFAALRAILD